MIEHPMRELLEDKETKKPGSSWVSMIRWMNKLFRDPLCRCRRRTIMGNVRHFMRLAPTS